MNAGIEVLVVAAFIAVAIARSRGRAAGIVPSGRGFPSEAASWDEDDSGDDDDDEPAARGTSAIPLSTPGATAPAARSAALVAPVARPKLREARVDRSPQYDPGLSVLPSLQPLPPLAPLPPVKRLAKTRIASERPALEPLAALTARS